MARIHSEKIEELKDAHTSLLSFINNHSKATEVARPKIKFYSGIQGIKQAFIDMPWNKKYTEAYLMWPLQDMIDTLGEEFLKWHATPRFKYHIPINIIQRYGDMIIQRKKNEHDWLKSEIKENLNNIRYAPKGTDWQMSYWIYGDKCLFASSGIEKFAFTINSREFVQIMKVMWQEVWNNSMELKS